MADHLKVTCSLFKRSHASAFAERQNGPKVRFSNGIYRRIEALRPSEIHDPKHDAKGGGG